MRKLILLFLLFCISLNLPAQRRVNLDNLSLDQLIVYKVKADQMRDFGLGMTLYGGGLIAIGGSISAIWFGAIPNDEESFGIPAIPLIVGLAIGIPMVVVGLPLWSVGVERKSRAEIAIKNFHYVPGKSSVQGLTFTFRF